MTKGLKYSLGMALLIVALFVVNLLVGSVKIPASEVLRILLLGEEGSKASWSFILWESRLPQAITALLCGGALSVCGLMLQTAFNNPLSGPSILGINSGANLGVALVMLLFGGTLTTGSFTLSGFFSILAGAFVGSMLIMAIILFLSTLLKSNLMLLIAGIMIGYITSSAISLLNFFATAEEAATLYPHMEDTYPIVEQTMENYKLKVMSFNVQTENGTQVDFDLRAEMLRDLMDELQPDSIGMQEVTTGWIYRMDTFAFNASYAGVGEGRTPGGEASSIYYRKDKFDLVNSGTFWLSETPDEAGTYLEASLYPRICTWAHLRDKVTGYEYIHVNTHLDHLGGSDGRSLRTAQTRVILEYLKTLPDVPMVMTGDFNQAKTNSEENTYAIFKNILGQSNFTASTGEKMTGNFSDARAEAKDTVASDAWASMTAYWQEGGEKYNPAKKPIDYVFYTTADFDAMVYRNIHYHRDGIYMSDHLPQYCELTVTVPAADGE